MARELVRDAIVSAGIRVDVDDATVAVSEIVSNVVRHAGTAMLVNVVAGPYLRVEVTDSRPELPVPQPGRSNGGGWSVHGRGLRIVDRLAARWGQTHDAGSKTVWFELDPAQTQPARQ